MNDAENRSNREQCNLSWLESFFRTQRESMQSLGSDQRKRRRDCQKGIGGAPEVLSPFQQRVFIMVGMAMGGLWNEPIIWDEIRWSGPNMLTLPIRHELATFDGSALLSLVTQATRYGIRMVVRSRYLKMEMQFSAMGGSDGMNRVHPGLPDMVTILADDTQTCGGCRYFEPLFGGLEDDEETTGSCRFPRGALPLSITRNSMSLANSSCPEANWKGCGCWTAKGREFDIKKDESNAQS